MSRAASVVCWAPTMHAKGVEMPAVQLAHSRPNRRNLFTLDRLSLPMHPLVMSSCVCALVCVCVRVRVCGARNSQIKCLARRRSLKPFLTARRSVQGLNGMRGMRTSRAWRSLAAGRSATPGPRRPIISRGALPSVSLALPSSPRSPPTTHTLRIAKRRSNSGHCTSRPAMSPRACLWAALILTATLAAASAACK